MAFYSRTWSIGILVAALGCAAAHAAAVPADEVTKATLPNGLRVIIVPNHLAHVVATAVNYAVGSDDAPAGFPGMAHAQEHMMFRGTPDLSADQLASIGSLLGGNFNANTRESLTQYLFTVPSGDLEVALQIEAERMRAVTDSEEGWTQERGAIEQEVDQDLSSPAYVLFTKLRSRFFAGSTYEHDALGTRESFDKTTGAMLKAFHDSWYAPNNAVLVVVGDVDAKVALSQIDRIFGAIPAKKLPDRVTFDLKDFPRDEISIKTDEAYSTALIAFRVPGLDSADLPALEVLSDVLNSQRAALHGMVAEGRALGAGFAFDPLPKAGVAYIYASVADSKAISLARDEIVSDLNALLKDGVSPDLVATAKNDEARRAEFQKNSIEGLASVWSDAVALYGLNNPADDIRRIEGVSVDDVNRVARAYLRPESGVPASMISEGSGTAKSGGSGFGGGEAIALGEAKDTVLPAWAQYLLTDIKVPASEVHPKITKLANGLTVIVLPEAVSDTVSVYGHIRNRPEIEEGTGKEGVSELADRLFEYGTPDLDRLHLQQALDAAGAQETAGMDFSVQVLAKDFEQGVGLLAKNELSPAFPDSDVAIVREQLAQATEAEMVSPDYRASRALKTGLFSMSDPILREPTPATIRSLTRDDVAAFYKGAYRPDLTTIVVVGNLDPDVVIRVINAAFGQWKAEGATPDIDLPPATPNAPAIAQVPDTARVQDEVVLAQTLAVSRSDPDYYALQLGSSILGGGFYASRLSIDLRKENGLVYSVSSQLQCGRIRGLYFVQFASEPKNVAAAADLVRREIDNLKNVPIPTAEMDRAKALLIRQSEVSDSSIEAVAKGLIRRQELNLPLDEPTRAAARYIALDPEDVQNAFRKWLRPESLVQIVKGPAP